MSINLQSRGNRIARLLVAAILTVASMVSLPNLTVEGDMNTILARTNVSLQPEARNLVDAWQNPPVVAYVRWRDEDLLGYLPALSKLVFDLQFQPGVEEVVSLFSLVVNGAEQNDIRAASDGEFAPRPALSALRENVIFGSDFVGPDLRSTIIFAQGDPTALQAIPRLIQRCEPAEALCVMAIGSVAMEAEIERELESGNRLLPFVGGGLCFLLVALWYGDPKRAFWLVVPPSLGLVWYFGLISWLGQPVDIFNTIVPCVILSLGLADMLHLQSARNFVDSGEQALGIVFPAITLTTFTTAIGFATIAAEGSEALSRLALLGVLGVICLWIAVVLVGPTAVSSKARTSRGPRMVIALGLAFLTQIGSNHLKMRVAALAALVAGGVLFWITPADFRFEENVPRSVLAAALQDASSDGLAAAPFFVLGSASSEAEQVSAASRLYGQAVDPASIPRELRADEDTFVLPYLAKIGESAAELLESAEAIRNLIEIAPPVSVQGYPISAAQTLVSAIERLKVFLLVCFALQALILIALLRSVRLGIAALVPNLLPVFAISAAAWFGSEATTFATAISMIVASGIVADDTAHLLLASRGGRSGFSITRGLRRVLEPVTLTTLVLLAGVASLLFSGLPAIKQFAALFMLAIAVAWLADVLLLSAFLSKKQKMEATK